MRHPAPFIANHLLVCLTLAFISGIAVAPLYYPAPSVVKLTKIGSLCCLVFLAALTFYRWEHAALCLLLPFLAAIGWYHAQIHLQPPDEKNHIFNRIDNKTEAVIIGTLSSMATFDGTTSQVTVAVKHLRLADSAKLQPVTGKVLLRLQSPWPENLAPGDELAIRADLKRPESSRTSGVFDYANYLAQKDIWITGFVRSPAYLHKLAQKPTRTHILRYLPERIRTTIGKRIDTAVPAANRGVYRAILIGDYSRVDEVTMEAFKGSGTIHILSVSGLHMTVIGSFLYMIFYWLLSRSEWLLLRYPVRKIAVFLSLPVLVFYSLLAGLNTPVLRSVIMSGIVIVAVCTDRKKSPSTLVAFAAMLILAMDPLQLFTASFQLSFSAVIAILFLYPAIRKLTVPDITRPHPSTRKKIVNWIIAGLLVSVVATLATAPLTLWFFNRFSTVGIAANLVVEPLICLWSLPAGFLAIPFLLIQPNISDLLLTIGSVGLEGALHVVRFFSLLPGSTLWLPAPPLWLLTLYFVTLFGITWLASQQHRLSIAALLVFAVCCLVMISPPRFLYRQSPASLQVSFIDVGQGSSTLLEYPSGFTVLIDGGGSAAYGSSSVGERTIAPLLWHKGIRKLDAIAITHPDADHYNGLAFIVRHFSPSTIWVRDTIGHDNSYQQLMQLAAKGKIPVVVPEAGQRLGNDGEYLECIENLATKQISANPTESRQGANSGIILKGCYGELCALLPGDIGMSEERSLVSLHYDLAADFLLAPHHGSITSNSPELLTAVSPRLIVVSAGRSGGGHFPHKHLVNECETRKIPLFTTSRAGTLCIIAKVEAYQVLGYSRPDNNPLRPFQPVLLSEEKNVQKKD